MLRRKLRPSGDVSRLPVRWLPWLAGLIAWLIYARRSAPGIVTFFDDSLEFQVVAPAFGIAHPTGYPLYTLLAGIWTHLLPIGTWAGRVNLFSALAAAVAVGLVARLAARLTPTAAGRPNGWAGAAAAIVFGLGSIWASQATLAEVYALHNLFVAAILLAAVGINRAAGDATGPPYPPAFDRRMRLLLLLVGLGLTHHRTTALLLPPLALYLLWSVPGLWRPSRQWWGWAAALLAPLLLYLYLPLRAWMGTPDIHGGYTNSWTGFWRHVLARGFTPFFADNPIAAGYTLADWSAILLAQLGWIGVVAAGLGLLWLFDRRGRPARAWWFILTVLLLNAVFVWLYRVPDPEVFALPVLLCLALFAAGGVGLLARLLPSRLALPLQALFLLALLIVPAGRAPLPDRSDDWRNHDRARLMTLADFAPDSRVTGIEGEMTALRYMQLAEERARGVTLIAADDPAVRLELVAAGLEQGQPIYLTRELDGIGERYSYDGAGALVRIRPRGTSGVALPPEAIVTPPIPVGDGALEIVGYSARRVDGTAEPYVEVTLYWRKRAPTAQTLKVSLRAQDAEGEPLRWPDGAPAVADEYPLQRVARTPEWPLDDLIRDVYYLRLPPATTLEPQRIMVIVYDETTIVELARIEIMF